MKLRTVAFLARRPGELVFDELIAHPNIDLRHVITPAHLPSAEGGNMSPTAQYLLNQCTSILPNIKCAILNSQAVQTAPNFVRQHAPFDLLISLNWRHIIPDEVLAMAKTAVNIHRGDLPKYPGKRPILQALTAGDDIFAITTHHMTPELDDGPVICQAWHESPRSDDETIEAAEARIRTEMEPLYGPLVRRVIDSIVRERLAAA